MLHVAIDDAQLEKFIQDKIDRGVFASPVDVIAAGLSMLREDPDADLPPEELAELRAAIKVGTDRLERGEVSEWNAEKLKARLLKEFGAHRNGGHEAH